MSWNSKLGCVYSLLRGVLSGGRRRLRSIRNITSCPNISGRRKRGPLSQVASPRHKTSTSHEAWRVSGTHMCKSIQDSRDPGRATALTRCPAPFCTRFNGHVGALRFVSHTSDSMIPFSFRFSSFLCHLYLPRGSKTKDIASQHHE